MRNFNWATVSSHQNDFQRISLLSDSIKYNFLKEMTQDFTITTNNSSGKFNHIILVNLSRIISLFLKNNPNNFQYHLDIQDDTNAIEKLEKIFQGESAVFSKDDIKTSQIIMKMLNIFDFLELHSTNQGRIIQSNEIYIFKKISFVKFIIQTNKYEYSCNICGVYSSSVIRKYISENPLLYYYKYDFADEKNEFRFISNIFNFESVILTKDNANIIKEISKNLGIDYILKETEKFIQKNEKILQMIDDQQETIDSYDDLFNFLYNIKEKNIDSAVSALKESKWSQTKENVYELTAFIIHVIQTSTDYHNYMIDLLIKIDEDVKETDELKKLLPFTIKQSMFLFSKENSSYSNFNLIIPFVYKLYKRDIITREMLMKKLMKCQNSNNNYLISWFWPELNELNPKLRDISLVDDYVILRSNKKKLFYPCMIKDKFYDTYKTERDKGEYDLELEKALRNDDVDTFQSFVSKSLNGQLLKGTIKRQNIFEPFLSENTRYLNYAAAYGSVKCFKYMLLNDEQIDNSTFEMAVIGGNNEIIRIVDNKKIEIKDSIMNALKQSILRHQNDIFDWILEQKFSILNNNNDLLTLVFYSIESGNMHSFVQIIDYGFDLNINQKHYSELLGILAQKGFYSFIVFLNKLIYQLSDNLVPINSRFSVVYNNVLIFQLFENQFDEADLESALIYTSELGSKDIIEYFFDKIINKKLNMNLTNASNTITSSFNNHSKDFIDYIFDNITNFYTFDVKSLFNILNEAFEKMNNEAIIKALEFVYKNNPNNDFTELFTKTVKMKNIEIAKLFIDKKYSINFFELDEIIPSYDIELFLYIVNNVEEDIKETLIDCIDNAIKFHNIQVVQYLLTQDDVNMNKALLESVKANDYEIFDLILSSGKKIKNIKWQLEKSLKFIFEEHFIDTKQINKFLTKIINSNNVDLNYRTSSSTLTFACKQKLKEIVQLILKNDKVDVNLNVSRTGNTPLIISIINKSCEISKLLIEHKNINVNQMNYIGETPLILAVRTHQIFIINLILKNKNFNPEESKLNHSFYISTSEISQSLLTMDSLDVNYVPTENKDFSNFWTKNSKNIPRTVLINSIIKNNEQLSDLIIKHPSFYKNQTRVLEALYVSLYEKTAINYFIKILNSNDNINIYSPIFKENSLLIEAIENLNELVINTILDNPNFDSKKGKIDVAFLKIISEMENNSNSYRSKNIIYLNLLNKLYNYDIDHDRLIDIKLKENDSKILSDLYNIKFNGSKKVDYCGYNLKQAIEGDQSLFAICIINLNIINLNQCIQDKFVYGSKNQNNTSYLHLAVRYSKSRIIEEILSKNLCDINITNNLGETPLMEACRCKKDECIKYLFKFDNLDFLHVNNDGDDALKILQKMVLSKSGDNVDNSVVIENKDEYLSELLKELDVLQKQSNSFKKPIPENETEKHRKIAFASSKFDSKKTKNSDKTTNPPPPKPKASWGKFNGWGQQQNNDYKKSNSGWLKK